MSWFPKTEKKSSKAKTGLTLLFADGARAIRYDLPARGTVRIGRSPKCEVILTDTTVSSIHAEVIIAEGEVVVRDLESTNGTKVHGVQLVGNTAVLQLDGSIEVGGVSGTLKQSNPRIAEPSRAPVAEDESSKALYDRIARIAPSSLPVLILGPSGSGKEVAARAIHRSSGRSGPWVDVNCSTFIESLTESQLFGHVPGAFSGATEASPGLVRQADRGTLFLDEVTEMPPSIQVKLLRVIEEGAVRAVGGHEVFPVDVRFVAATNTDLSAAVESGRFRKDLFYRLNGCQVVLAPLRERPLDLHALARIFVRNAAYDVGRKPPKLSSGAMDALLAHAWPGNVRELRHLLNRAVLMLGPKNELQPEDLGLETVGDVASLQSAVDVAERQRIVEAIEKAGGNQTEAAKILRISRRTLLNRLDKYGLPRPRKR